MTRPGMVRWLAGLAALIGLTLLVLAGASLSLDDTTLGWFTRLDRPGVLHGIWRTLVMGGQFWLVGTAAVVIGVIRAVQWRSWRTLIVSVAAVASVDVILLVSKPLIGRTSPHSGRNEVLVGGNSYPSGHTSNATMCLALIAVLLAGTSAYRRRALFVAGFCAAVVGICNLVLGYHWLSEVVAGWIFGTLVVTAAASLLPRERAQKTLVPTVSDGGHQRP